MLIIVTPWGVNKTSNSPKKTFSPPPVPCPFISDWDTIIQHFVDELKYYNPDMKMNLRLLVAMFLCLYSMYLVFMLLLE